MVYLYIYIYPILHIFIYIYGEIYGYPDYLRSCSQTRTINLALFVPPMYCWWVLPNATATCAD